MKRWTLTLILVMLIAWIITFDIRLERLEREVFEHVTGHEGHEEGL